ncbi:MAG: VCBS repeat-containing protein, partial [Myxococcales bacterium]|nr:VCBS repeat-containing protein [Myxococcales bacterium]
AALAVACGPTTLTSESAGSETDSGGSSSAGATETGVDEDGCPTPAESCRGAPLDLEAVAAGDGGFAVAGDEVPAALGDVNGDGLDDLGFAGFVVFSEPHPGALSDDPAELAARGFAVTWSAPAEPPRVEGAGDVNGDGLADLVAVDGESRRAWVIFGKADLAPVTLEAVSAGSGGYVLDGVRSFAARLGDVDGDGLADLALRPADTYDTIAVFSGKADGSPVDIAVAPALEVIEADDVRAADIDGDDVVDLALCGAGDGTELMVLSAPAGWETATRSAMVFGWCWGGTTAFDVRDLNGDGVVDVSVLQFVSENSEVRSLFLGPIAEAEPLLKPPYVHCGVRGCVVADVTGDGSEELINADFRGDVVGDAWVAPLSTIPPAMGSHASPAPCEESTATLLASASANPPPYLLLFEPLGDVNGDGRVDLYMRGASAVITRVCDLPAGG